MTMKRKPPPHVLGISPVLLKAECTVVAQEDIYAIVARLAVERCYDASGHVGSVQVPNDQVDRRAYAAA